jgi:hypothetical protein
MTAYFNIISNPQQNIGGYILQYWNGLDYVNFVPADNNYIWSNIQILNPNNITNEYNIVLLQTLDNKYRLLEYKNDIKEFVSINYNNVDYIEFNSLVMQQLPVLDTKNIVAFTFTILNEQTIEEANFLYYQYEDNIVASNIVSNTDLKFIKINIFGNYYNQNVDNSHLIFVSYQNSNEKLYRSQLLQGTATIDNGTVTGVTTQAKLFYNLEGLQTYEVDNAYNYTKSPVESVIVSLMSNNGIKYSIADKKGEQLQKYDENYNNFYINYNFLEKAVILFVNSNNIVALDKNFDPIGVDWVFNGVTNFIKNFTPKYEIKFGFLKLEIPYNEIIGITKNQYILYNLDNNTLHVENGVSVFDSITFDNFNVYLENSSTKTQKTISLYRIL